MNHMKFESPDMTALNIDRIAALFPNCATEMLDEERSTPEKKAYKRAVNFELLKQMLSPDVVDGDEAYEFTWVGKKAAIVEANKPIRKTLRPVLKDETIPTGADSEGKPYCSSGSKDWDTTENLYIEGDNLEVLKLLQESYLGKVKMIYIDPPYNTGNDFIYADDFMRSQEEENEQMGMYDEDENRLFKNTDTNGRFHSDWCSMIYSRLMLARNLLTDDGVVFISIDDNEQENLKKCCDEVFGESNFVGKIAVVNNLKGRNDRKDIATCHEYILIYGKSEFAANGMPLTDEQKAQFDKVDENGSAYQLRDLRKRGRPDRREDRPNMYFPIYYNLETKKCSLVEEPNAVAIYPIRGDGSDGRWRWGKERVAANLAILEPRYSSIAKRWGIEHRVYLNPSLNPVNLDEEDTEDTERSSKSKSFWIGGELSNDVGRRQLKTIFGAAYFDYPKSIDYILNTIYMGSDSDSIILDFFSGSATTAHAVMQLNAEDGGHRKFIMVQLPEKCDEASEAYKAGYKNICEIGKERIRRAGDKIKSESPTTTQDLDIGFRVLKLDDTNMKDVYYNPAEYEVNMFSRLEDNIKEDRTPEDLLFQVMLDLGVLLSSKIEETTIAGKKVFNVEDNYLIACFDSDVSEETIKAIAKQKPYYFVMRDSSMASDSVATNFDQIFATYSPDTVRKVL